MSDAGYWIIYVSCGKHDGISFFPTCIPGRNLLRRRNYLLNAWADTERAGKYMLPSSVFYNLFPNFSEAGEYLGISLHTWEKPEAAHTDKNSQQKRFHSHPLPKLCFIDLYQCKDVY